MFETSSAAAVAAPAGWQGRLRAAEDLLLTLALAAMVLLPLAEALLRKLFAVGISGASSIVQHLVLIVGMLGGAVAARESRDPTADRPLAVERALRK